MPKQNFWRPRRRPKKKPWRNRKEVVSDISGVTEFAKNKQTLKRNCDIRYYVAVCLFVSFIKTLCCVFCSTQMLPESHATGEALSTTQFSSPRRLAVVSSTAAESLGGSRLRRELFGAVVVRLCPCRSIAQKVVVDEESGALLLSMT